MRCIYCNRMFYNLKALLYLYSFTVIIPSWKNCWYLCSRDTIIGILQVCKVIFEFLVAIDRAWRVNWWDVSN